MLGCVVPVLVSLLLLVRVRANDTEDSRFLRAHNHDLISGARDAYHQFLAGNGFPSSNRHQGSADANGQDRHADIPRDRNPSYYRSKLQQFRKNIQNRKSKRDATGKTMGDPSTVVGLANGLSENATIRILEDDPFLLRFFSSPMATGQDVEDFLIKDAASRDVSFRNANLPTRSSETQRVYLDFNNGVNYTAVINGVVFELPAHVYTLEEQVLILEAIRKDYAGFNVEFFMDEEVSSLDSPDDGGNGGSGAPPEGEFATIQFNADIVPIVLNVDNGQITGFSILFGLATNGIDFLNVNYEDLSLVNANFWELLVTVDPTGELLSAASGIPIDGEKDVAEALSNAVVTQSAQTGAHEQGHLMGLRHHDAIGAIGNGIPAPPNRPFDGAFVPNWTGQRNATESLLHLLASGNSLGLSVQARANGNPFFSERSAIKLAFSDGKGEVRTEADAKNGIISLPDLEVPNTIVEGENAGPETLQMNALVITGNIAELTDVDNYRLSLEEGTFLTAELISTSSAYIEDRVLTRLSLFLEDGDALTEVFNNSQVFEPFDPLMIDVPIAETGTYVVAVNARQEVYVANNTLGIYDTEATLPENSTFLFGDYWLLLYNLDHKATPNAQQDADITQHRESPTDITSPTSASNGGDQLEELLDDLFDYHFRNPQVGGNRQSNQDADTQTSNANDSEEPSFNPSVPPSSEPSLEHSSGPTSVPTSKPTRMKRSPPTATPSVFPSEQPSPAPTTSLPSLDPSGSPSFEPSSEPSSLPTSGETAALELDSSSNADTVTVANRNQGPSSTNTFSSHFEDELIPKPRRKRMKKRGAAYNNYYEPFVGRRKKKKKKMMSKGSKGHKTSKSSKATVMYYEEEDSVPFLEWLPTSDYQGHGHVRGRRAVRL